MSETIIEHCETCGVGSDEDRGYYCFAGEYGEYYCSKHFASHPCKPVSHVTTYERTHSHKHFKAKGGDHHTF